MNPAVLIVLTIYAGSDPQMIAHSGAIAMQAFHSIQACEAAKAIITKRGFRDKFAECIEDK